MVRYDSKFAEGAQGAMKSGILPKVVLAIKSLQSLALVNGDWSQPMRPLPLKDPVVTLSHSASLFEMTTWFRPDQSDQNIGINSLTVPVPTTPMDHPKALMVPETPIGYLLWVALNAPKALITALHAHGQSFTRCSPYRYRLLGKPLGSAYFSAPSGSSPRSPVQRPWNPTSEPSGSWRASTARPRMTPLPT